MKKIALLFALSLSLFGGSFSLTMMYLASPVISAGVQSGMTYTNVVLSDTKSTHTKGIRDRQKRKNIIYTNLRNIEEEIAIELKKIKELNEKQVSIIAK